MKDEKISLREGVPDVSMGDVMSKLGNVDYSNFVSVLQENLETIRSVSTCILPGNVFIFSFVKQKQTKSVMFIEHFH